MGLCSSKPKVTDTEGTAVTSKRANGKRKPIFEDPSKLSPIPEVSSSETAEEVEIRTMEQKRLSVQLVRSQESFPMRKSSVSLASAEDDAPLQTSKQSLEQTNHEADRVPTPTPENPIFEAQASEGANPFQDFDSEEPVDMTHSSPFSCQNPDNFRAQYSTAYPRDLDPAALDARLDDIESQVDMLQYMHDRTRQDFSRDLGQQRMDLDALMEVVHELCERDLIEMQSQDSEVTVQRL